MREREGDLEFDFTAARGVDKLDSPGRRKPEGMALVDFVIEEERRLIMVEIKDPSCRPTRDDPAADVAIARSRVEFLAKVKNDSLIAGELVPKARDSYSYLHLHRRDTKPILYAFVLGVDRLELDGALLMGFKERLLARLRQETEQPWARRYVVDCLVLTERTWPFAFPQYPLVRIQ